MSHSGIRVNNQTEKVIRVRLSHVGPLYEAIIQTGQSFHFDGIGNVFFTVSVEECLDETKTLRTSEIALPIVATVLGSVGGTAVVIAGLAVLGSLALPLLGVGAGSGITVGSGVVVGSTVSGTGIIAGSSAVGSGVGIGTGLAASTGLGIGSGVAVTKGVGLGTAVVISTSVTAATGASVAITSGLASAVSVVAGVFGKIKQIQPVNDQIERIGKEKKYSVRSNGTDINVGELNGRFTITKL